MHLLHTYSWPGNIRELENSIERACVLGKPPLIYAEDLRLTALENTAVQSFDLRAHADKQKGDMSLTTALFDFKRAYVINVLEQTGWNQTEAAKLLGVQRTYVCRLLNELKIR